MAIMVARKRHPDPRVAGWLDDTNSTEFTRRIITRAFLDIGTQETPAGSNRGKRIDTWLRRANVPESMILGGKGWWCAAWLGAVWTDAGALVPRDYAAVDAWLPFLETEMRHGSAIVYGVRGNGHHIGLIARLGPVLETIEGNRAFAGTTNNGVAVDIGPPTRRDILGYVHPRKAV